MRYVAAYLPVMLGGKAAPATADVEKILSSIGIEADGGKLKKVIAEFSGKNIEELIEQDREKLPSMPASGAAPVSGGGDAPAAAAAAEEKKEEKAKKVEYESDDDDMGSGLFD